MYETSETNGAFHERCSMTAFWEFCRCLPQSASLKQVKHNIARLMEGHPLSWEQAWFTSLWFHDKEKIALFSQLYSALICHLWQSSPWSASFICSEERHFRCERFSVREQGLFVKPLCFDRSHKAVADTSISSPPHTDKYSTTAQTAKAIATQRFTAQRRTRKQSSLPHYTLLAGHPFSIKFVMQLQLTIDHKSKTMFASFSQSRTKIWKCSNSSYFLQEDILNARPSSLLQL